MLYDILIIDDDFSGETVLGEMDLEAQTTSDTIAWEETVFPLYFGLIRDNLKVIWSTGELDDLDKLGKSQLSKVRYIICDLHLSGIDTNANNKTIISKIMGILEALKDSLDGNISFLVNSKYIGIDSHKHIKQELKEALGSKYSVSAFPEKNAITPEQKQELLDISLLSHIKEQIIKKHLEVERCLDEKITEDDIVLNELSFFSKHKIVKETYDLKSCNRKITKLNESRNAIAHTEINTLTDLRGIKKIDSKIKNIKQFSDLLTYLETIDQLIADIAKTEKK